MIRQSNEQWACFTCRKVFRKPSRYAGVGYHGPEPEHPCPQCRILLLNVGRYFEAPRRHNEKRWAALHLLADSGYRWHKESAKYWADNFLLIKPLNLEALCARLEHYRHKTAGERLLEGIHEQHKR